MCLLLSRASQTRSSVARRPPRAAAGSAPSSRTRPSRSRSAMMPPTVVRESPSRRASALRESGPSRSSAAEDQLAVGGADISQAKSLSGTQRQCPLQASCTSRRAPPAWPASHSFPHTRRVCRRGIEDVDMAGIRRQRHAVARADARPRVEPRHHAWSRGCGVRLPGNLQRHHARGLDMQQLLGPQMLYQLRHARQRALRPIWNQPQMLGANANHNRAAVPARRLPRQRGIKQRQNLRPPHRRHRTPANRHQPRPPGARRRNSSPGCR